MVCNESPPCNRGGLFVYSKLLGMNQQAISAVVPGAKLNDLALDLSKITVGFEFEFVSSVSHADFAKEMKGTDPDYKIGAITDEYAGHKKWGTSAPRYKVWHITGDPTIETSDDLRKKAKGKYGIELISPALPINRVKRTLLDILAIIHRVGGTSNASCGLHVTFGHPDLNVSLENFDPLKFSIFLQEDKLLAKFDRSRNEFAQNFSAQILQAMHEEMTQLGGKVMERESPNFEVEDESDYPSSYNQVDPNESTGPALTDENLKDLINTTRVRQRFALYSHYMSINLIKLKNHCVEIRSPGNDYLSRSPDELVQMVLHMARCLALAMSPSMLEDKYVLAVRRMLKQYNPVRTNYDFSRQQKELTVQEAVRTRGSANIGGYVHLAGHSVHLVLTHGDAKNPKSEASATWTVSGSGGGRVALRLYVDTFGNAEAVVPSKETLDKHPATKDVVAALSIDLIKASEKQSALPGLLRLAPSVAAYKSLLERFPKLSALKLNVTKFRDDLVAGGVV